ncbi:TIGR02099 family protein [Thalassolituus sp. ST750PaO-4]|uniref:YhdP family protein n=1 Tax=Thalassolituus sp. ST750PaO-4 TaxID=2742965 RepID=UPI001CE3143C|nr:YhdP family protein [Thalassolituus sp. ST750PaO-4]MCA6060018.1 TIGR02099 family protein [Thalassolituus sp. ST750PaO-4]
MIWLREFWTQIWITLVVAAVTLALYTSLGRQLIPLVETYRADLEHELSLQLGQPVSIGQLQGDWNMLSPVVRMRDVQVGLLADGIHVARMEAELDVSASAFYRLPVFKRIEIQGVRADLYQRDQTHWSIGRGWSVDLSGIKRQPAAADNVKIAASSNPLWLNWLELQQAIVLTDWNITSFDPQMTREDVQIDRLVWRNRGDSHELDGNLAWGREQLANIKLMASVDGDLWPWYRQNGEVFLRIDNQEWTRWIPDQLPGGLSIERFTAGAEAWLSIRDGDLNALYVDADIPAFTLNTSGQPLALSGGSLKIGGEHNGDDWHLRVLPQFDQQLPLDSLSLSAITLPQQKGWQIGVPLLDVAAARRFILDHQLLPEPFDQYVEGTDGRGEARNLRISLLPGEHWQVDVRSDIVNASSAAYHGIPAFSDVTGTLHLQPQGGLLQVKGDDLSVHLADVYSQPWDLKKLSAGFYWAIKPDFYQLQLRGLKAGLQENDSATVWPLSGELAINLPRSHSATESTLSLLFGLPQAPASLRSQLVPELLDEAVRDWLGQSIVAGDFRDAAFLLHGNLEHEHPDNSLTTQLYLEVEGAELKYMPDWPALRAIKGRLMMDAPALDVWLEQGKTLGGELVPHSGRVRLRPGRDGHTELSVAGRLRGDSGDALRYFTETPLQGVVNNAFDHWQANGPMTANMLLEMPLGAEHAEPEIKLDVELSDNQLRLDDLNIDLANLKGRLRYNSQVGLLSDWLEGDVFGGHFNAGIESVGRPGGFDMVLSANGDARWDRFKQWMPLFLLDPVSGALDYNARLTVGAQGVVFNFNSDLQGTAIDLPYPLGKTADSAARLMEVRVEPGTETRINLNYDNLLRAALALDADGLNRGQVYLGGSEPFLPSDKGVVVRGQLSESIVASDWWDTWQHLSGLLAAESKAQKAGATVKSEATAHSNNPLRSINLTLGGVDAWGAAMGPTHIIAAQQWDEWDFDVDSTLVKGKIRMLPGNEPIQLALDYIHLPQSEEEPGNLATLDGSQDEVTVVADKPDPLAALNPADFPPMDMDLAELYVGSRNFGRWKLSSRPQTDGMQITLHDSDMKGMAFTGDVYWLKQGDQHQTRLDTLQISSNDIGRVQRAFRQEAAIEGKDMRSTLQLNWQGSPLAYNNKTLNGLASFRVKDGNMAAEGAGALKAFGALNFNSVARRLKLDFSDLYQSGVAFDTLKGKARIENGLLTLTEPLSMDGPGGKFLTSGSTDLKTQTLDMKLAVTFPVSSTLPMVALLAGLAPPVAASIYVTEKLIGDELARFTSASYDLKGTWEKPDLKINQAFDDKVDGKKSRSLLERFKSIFYIFGGGDDD